MAKVKKNKISENIVNSYTSSIKLRCIGQYTVKAPNDAGVLEPLTYQVGEIRERKDIFINPTKWELAE